MFEKLKLLLESIIVVYNEKMSQTRTRRAIIKSLDHSIKGFKDNLTDLEYDKNSNIRVMGGTHQPKYIEINDPRGKYISVQIRWSFTNDNWGYTTSFPYNKEMDAEYIHYTHKGY